MGRKNKALEALDRIFNYCEEIDLHIPEEEQTGYSMNDDVAIIRKALYENRKTGHWIYIKNCVVNGLKIVECSECNKRTYGSGKYCPNCGAKMEGEQTMTREEAISILKRKSTIPDDDYCWDEIEEAFEMAIEAVEKIEKIEKILFQDYKHRDCGSEDSWYLEDIMNILKENKE